MRFQSINSNDHDANPSNQLADEETFEESVSLKELDDHQRVEKQEILKGVFKEPQQLNWAW